MKHAGGLKHKASRFLRGHDVQTMCYWKVPGDTSTFRLIPRPCVDVQPAGWQAGKQAGQFEWRKASLTEELSMQKSKCFVACWGQHSERGLPLGKVRDDVTM